ncbi:hypothetical protein [Haliea sp. E17]|uniref:hypothetical protein n=1 Tax=Haliea sp. E17 TaxID=3401576 RepID=UPI003AAC3B59
MTRTLALLLLLALPLSLSAQEATQAPDGEAADATAQAAPAGESSSKATVEKGQPADKPAQADKDPFDYQASEQISEDLSVSFPVDI